MKSAFSLRFQISIGGKVISSPPHSLLDKSVVAEYNSFHAIQENVTLVGGVLCVLQKTEKQSLSRSGALRVGCEECLTFVLCN